MPKKKFKETRIGKFLKEKVPFMIEKVGEILPEKGALGILKNIIEKDEFIPEKDKEECLKLIELDIAELEEISKRWDSDMTSDSWLSKNARPLVLLSMVGFMFICVLMDSFYKIGFEVSTEWIDLIKYVMMASVTAYFGVRGVEKSIKILKK